VLREVFDAVRHAVLVEVGRRAADREIERRDAAHDHAAVARLAGANADVVALGDHVAQRVVQMQLDLDARIKATEFGQQRFTATGVTPSSFAAAAKLPAATVLTNPMTPRMPSTRASIANRRLAVNVATSG
jgi:hypothetical protein